MNYYKRLDTAIRQYTESKSHGSSTSSRTKKHRHKRKTQSRLSNNYNINGKDANNNSNSNSNNNQSSNKNGILGMLSSASSDIIQMISDLGSSSISIAQCTMVCLVLMVMINLYIALKMAYMGDQLYTLHSHNDQSSSSSSSSSFFSNFYQSHGKKSSSSSPLDIWRDQHHDDVDSMWHWLNQLDHSQKQHNNNENKKNKNDQHTNMNSNYILTEHFKHQGKVSPEFLKQHIMELEKMVSRTENSIDQVHKVVRKQRQNLLQNLAS